MGHFKMAASMKLRSSRLLLVGSVTVITGTVLLWFITQASFSAADIRSSPQWGWDFRNNLWSPAHLLLEGKSPYLTQQLFDANSVWMPMLIGLLFPIGALPLPIAKNVWMVVNVGILAGMVALSVRQSRPKPVLLGVCLVAVLLFPPLISHFVLGQFSLATVLLCLVTAELLDRKVSLMSLAWIAVALCLALTKPQLMPLVLLGVGTALHNRGGWRTAAGFVARLIGGCLLLSVPLWLAYPTWIKDFIGALRRNPVWYQPSTLQVLQTQLGTLGVMIWGALFLAASALTVWLWRQTAPPVAMHWTLALTVLITPYVWTWDFVLMLPLLIGIFFACNSWWARLVWVLGMGLCWITIIQIRLAATTLEGVSDEQFWWVSWALMAIAILSWGMDRYWAKWAGTHQVQSGVVE